MSTAANTRSRNFRNALGNFSTGVTVVSGLIEGRPPFGATVNSFSSVSLEPRIALFSLRKQSASLACFGVGQPFAVSVLGATHVDVARHFAVAHEDKWGPIPYATWDSGCPIVVGALAAFEGIIESHVEVADHIVLFGRVDRFGVSHSVRPLIFFRGQFGQLQLDPAPGA